MEITMTLQRADWKKTEAAEEMRFEQAAEYRDLIDSVRRIGEPAEDYEQ